MIDIFHFFQEHIELGMSGKTGIKKDNLLKAFLPRSRTSITMRSREKP